MQYCFKGFNGFKLCVRVFIVRNGETAADETVRLIRFAASTAVGA